MTEKNSTAVSVDVFHRFTDSELAAVDSYAAAFEMLKAGGFDVVDIADYGSGFEKIEDKDILISVPFVITTFRFAEGDYTDESGNKSRYVIAELVTKDGAKYLITDGSTGICSQLLQVYMDRAALGSKAPNVGVLCEKGVTKSEYYFNAKTGEKSNKPVEGPNWGPASTYYLVS